jgi:NitT/TauT family transport system substrate-binding protein
LKKLIFFGLILSVALMSIGCIFSPDTNPENITTLRIGYQPSTHQMAEMVASDKGWWLEDLKPFGVKEIREYGYPSGPPEMQAMVAAELDIAYVGTSPPITAISQGLDAKIVAAVNINGSDLVIRPGVPYGGPQSLIGLRIATFPPGSIQDMVMKKWLHENGVEISSIKILPMGPGDAVTAIEAGKVDGVFLPHPSPTIIQIADKGKAIASSGEMWPDHACCSLIVSGKLIRAHPDLVEQIIKTHIKATDYVNANPEEAAKIYSNHTGQDLNMIESSIRTWDGKWISDPYLQISSTLEYAKIDFQMNFTEKELTEKELFDTSFYDKAK